MSVSKFIEFVNQKFPTVFPFVFRRTSRFLRHFFPYNPTVVEEEDGAEWLVVRPSLIPEAGNGLFVTQFCPAGTVLCEYKGTRLTGLQLLRTRDWTYIACYKFDFWIDAKYHPKVKARFINHHFDPSKRNVRWDERDGRVFYVAERDILPEEELYSDYTDEHFENKRYFDGLG